VCWVSLASGSTDEGKSCSRTIWIKLAKSSGLNAALDFNSFSLFTEALRSRDYSAPDGWNNIRKLILPRPDADDEDPTATRDSKEVE